MSFLKEIMVYIKGSLKKLVLTIGEPQKAFGVTFTYDGGTRLNIGEGESMKKIKFLYGEPKTHEDKDINGKVKQKLNLTVTRKPSSNNKTRINLKVERE